MNIYTEKLNIEDIIKLQKIDIERLKVPQLKNFLKKINLDIKGKKLDLINRLYAFVEEQRNILPKLENISDKESFDQELLDKESLDKESLDKESLDKTSESIENMKLSDLKQFNTVLCKDLENYKNKFNNNISIFNNYKNTHNKHIFYLTDELEKLKESIIEKDIIIEKYKKDIESKTTNTVNHINVDINSIEDQTQFLKFYKELTTSNNLPTNYNYDINTENNSTNIRKV